MIVRIKTQDGIEGVGFSYAGYESGELVGIATERLLAPLVLHHDASQPQDIWDRVVRNTTVHGHGGIVQRGISAIDIALWDRNAKAADLPLYRFIDPESRTAVPFYVGGGYYRKNDQSGKLLASELQGYAQAGYPAVKIKAGRPSKAEERRRAGIAREVLGNCTDLVFDTNGAFNTIESALEFIEIYADAAPLFIEDPFGSWALDAYKDLNQLSPVPLSTGETLTTESQFEILFNDRSIGVLQLDATACGGITAFMHLANRAASKGMTVETHWFPELHAQLAAATPAVKRAEYFPDNSVINFGILVESYLNRYGDKLHLPDVPGIGVSLNLSTIEEHCVHLA